MRLLGRGDNPNAVAGLFLLILLLVLAGPSAFPRLVENVEFADEGVPCRWLRQGEDRATKPITNRTRYQPKPRPTNQFTGGDQYSF